MFFFSQRREQLVKRLFLIIGFDNISGLSSFYIYVSYYHRYYCTSCRNAEYKLILEYQHYQHHNLYYSGHKRKPCDFIIYFSFKTCLRIISSLLKPSSHHYLRQTYSYPAHCSCESCKRQQAGI